MCDDEKEEDFLFSSDVFYSKSEEERVSLISVTLELIYLTRDKRCFMAYDGNVVFIL